MRAFRHIKVILAALGGLIAAGIAGFHFIEGWPWRTERYAERRSLDFLMRFLKLSQAELPAAKAS